MTNPIRRFPYDSRHLDRGALRWASGPTRAPRRASRRIPTAYGDFTADVYDRCPTAPNTSPSCAATSVRCNRPAITEQPLTDEIKARHNGEPHADATDHNGVLVQVHSECLTGDVFGSLRCDCGLQLDLALYRIAARRTGSSRLPARSRGPRDRARPEAARVTRCRSKARHGGGNLESASPPTPASTGSARVILLDLGRREDALDDQQPAEVRGHRGLRHRDRRAGSRRVGTDGGEETSATCAPSRRSSDTSWAWATARSSSITEPAVDELNRRRVSQRGGRPDPRIAAHIHAALGDARASSTSAPVPAATSRPTARSSRSNRRPR